MGFINQLITGGHHPVIPMIFKWNNGWTQRANPLAWALRRHSYGQRISDVFSFWCNVSEGSKMGLPRMVRIGASGEKWFSTSRICVDRQFFLGISSGTKNFWPALNVSAEILPGCHGPPLHWLVVSVNFNHMKDDCLRNIGGCVKTKFYHILGE